MRTKRPSYAPGAVYRISRKQILNYSQKLPEKELILSTEGKKLGGRSVAVPYANKLLVGSPFDRGMLQCDLKALLKSAKTPVNS